MPIACFHDPSPGSEVLRTGAYGLILYSVQRRGACGKPMWRLPYYLIQGYRRFLSPLLPASCRFHPTCSAYGAEALRSHGFWRGLGLTLKRVIRCHPWHPGGYDPVPPPSEDTAPSLDAPLSPSTNGESSHG